MSSSTRRGGVHGRDGRVGDRDATRHVDEAPGQEFGEGYIMWRCTECGEMGELDDGLPAACPSCGASKETLARQRED